MGKKSQLKEKNGISAENKNVISACNYCKGM